MLVPSPGSYAIQWQIESAAFATRDVEVEQELIEVRESEAEQVFELRLPSEALRRALMD